MYCLRIHMLQQLIAARRYAMRTSDVGLVVRRSESQRKRTEAKERVELAVVKEKHATNSVQPLNIRKTEALLVTVRGVGIEDAAQGLRIHAARKRIIALECPRYVNIDSRSIPGRRRHAQEFRIPEHV